MKKVPDVSLQAEIERPFGGDAASRHDAVCKMWLYPSQRAGVARGRQPLNYGRGTIVFVSAG